jgi:biopolymer transport protein ExbB
MIENVAGPVGEALIMTAFGLVVAIPAVLGYNVLGRIQRQLSDDLDGFAHDLHASLAALGGGGAGGAHATQRTHDGPGDGKRVQPVRAS